MDTALESSVYVSSPEFAGWLTKKGFHWRKLWKKRWVALHGAEIVYMDKEPSLEDAANMTVTKAQINSSTVIDRDDIDGNPNGFAIHVNDGQSPTWYLRADSAREKKSWLMRLSHVHAIVRWLENYEKVRVLGVGGSGIVYELLHKSNGRRFAMKEMEIKNKTQMQMAISEAEMLKDIMENVSHPNVMHIEKVFQVGSKFYMVFPLCTGGELYEHIIRRGHFTEYDAALLMRDLVGAIHALHEHNILHLDIKPENVLFDSMDENAKIKVTDFGLSREFTPQMEEQQKNKFSMEIMMNKLRAFSESGELNRERLRGTIGYMSPELILMGYCSKTTDVFAAGVVLYILLCGRPPFNSKSNREVLEKTAKGIYSMAGPEWEEVSDDAKDLVRRMLVTNPEQRISTADILAHPWLSNLDEVPTGEDADAAQGADSAGDDDAAAASALRGVGMAAALSKRTTGRRGLGANLTGALKQLSGHVHRLQSEKMATNMTRLVSLMQGEGSGHSILVSRYLVPLDAEEAKKLGPGQPSEGESMEKVMMEVMSVQIRSLFVAALNKLQIIRDGKIRNEHFMAIAKHFNPRLHSMGSSSSTASSNSSSAPQQGCSGSASGSGAGIFTLLLLCRFIDRDGDGYISMDDIFTSQAQMLQRSEGFLRVMFRVYTESLWYPGRQLNMLNLQQQVLSGEADLPPVPSATGGSSSAPPAPATPTSTPAKAYTRDNSGVRVLDSSGSASGMDVVEPPRYITNRHVAAVFERLGFDPVRGQRAFQLLCDAVARTKGSKGGDGEGGGMDDRQDSFADWGGGVADRDSVAAAANSNMAKDVAAAAAAAPNAALAAAFGDLDVGGSAGGRGGSLSASAGGRGGSLSASAGVSAAAGASGAGATKDIVEGSSSSRKHLSSGAASTSGKIAAAKMDVEDFIKAVSLDDILIQALLKNSRENFFRLRERMQAAAKAASEGCGADSGEIQLALVAAELQEALSNFKGADASASPNAAHFPLAQALGRAAYGIAKGLKERSKSSAAPTGSTGDSEAAALAAALAAEAAAVDSDDEV